MISSRAVSFKPAHMLAFFVPGCGKPHTRDISKQVPFHKSLPIGSWTAPQGSSSPIVFQSPKEDHGH